MSSPQGSKAWMRAWTPDRRQGAVDLAGRSSRRIAGWLGAAAAGLVVAVVTMVVGDPVGGGVGGTVGGDLPPRSLTPVLVALVVDLGALGVSLLGWQRIGRSFAGSLPPSPESLRPARVGTAIAGLVALVVSVVCAVLAGVSPAVAIAQGQIGWADMTSAVVVVVSVCCGFAAIRLWVNLLPLQQAGSVAGRRRARTSGG